MASPQIKRMLEQQLDIRDRGLLLTPKYEAWLSQHGGELPLSEEEADQFAQLLSDHLARKPRVRAGAFSASSAGYCERAQVFGYLGMPQKVKGDSKLSLIFIDGKMKHLVWQFIGLQAGALTDIELPIFPEAFTKWRMKGSIDGADLFNGIGLELKTTMAFLHFCKSGPGHLHKMQVGRYFLTRDDLDVFCIIYLDTTTREWKEYPILRDKAVMRLVKDELHRLNEAVDYKRLPEVQDECKTGKGATFYDCGYSHICLGCRSYEEAEAWVSIRGNNEGEAAGVQGGRGSAEPQAARKGTRRVRRRTAR